MRPRRRRTDNIALNFSSLRGAGQHPSCCAAAGTGRVCGQVSECDVGSEPLQEAIDPVPVDEAVGRMGRA
jgi:hypothetical protein